MCPNSWFDDLSFLHEKCFPERRGEAWKKPESKHSANSELEELPYDFDDIFE
jgi:hypothetical protein